MTKTKLLMIAALAPVVIATLNVGAAAAHPGYNHHHGGGYHKKKNPKLLPLGPEVRTPNKPLCTRNGVCR